MQALSVVIPAFNEQESIRRVVTVIRELGLDLALLLGNQGIDLILGEGDGFGWCRFRGFR